MISQKQYNQLVAVIQKANPDLMNLEFGCEVEVDWGGIGAPERETKVKAKFVEHYGNKVRLKWMGVKLFSMSSIKVLGRPITLADVLLALCKYAGNYFVDEDGCLIKAKRKEFTYYYLIENGDNIKWNLKNNSLDWHYHNKPETCHFFWKLLVDNV